MDSDRGPAGDDWRAGRRLFGTDGIRGVVGHGRLSRDVVGRLGRALAPLARTAAVPVPRDQLALVGRDPRPSGEALFEWLRSGLYAGGVFTADAGILPTPALAYLVARGGLGLGVMLSASHNPVSDNGIKLFVSGGRKPTEAEELEVERRVSHPDPMPSPAPMEWSEPTWPSDLDPRSASSLLRLERYVEDAATWLSPRDALHGLDLVVDVAAGSATATVLPLLDRLGVRAEVLHEAGSRDINDRCGSEHPEVLRAVVEQRPGGVGLALDGDADRGLLFGSGGIALDGDDALAVLALDALRSGRIAPGDAVVSTVMANQGLAEFLEARGLVLERTAVGDRNVARGMQRTGALFGGEPSGHVLLQRDDVAGKPLIGDGLVGALAVLVAAHRLRLSLRDVRGLWSRYPQRLVNVRVSRREPLEAWLGWREARRRAEELLGPSGRLVIRFSGTEPLLRIMAEGRDAIAVEAAVANLAAVAAEAG